MWPGSKLLRSRVGDQAHIPQRRGGSCRVDAYGWKRVVRTVRMLHATNFYIWYLRTCPKYPPAHNGFLYKERFQVDIRGFSIE
jgi:hypothetical protein